MRRPDRQQSDMFSYLSPEQRMRTDHPLREIRTIADQALVNMSKRLDAMYAVRRGFKLSAQEDPPLVNRQPTIPKLGIQDVVAMRISGHKTRSMFDRYNIVDETDVSGADEKLEQYFERRKMDQSAS